MREITINHSDPHLALRLLALNVPRHIVEEVIKPMTAPSIQLLVRYPVNIFRDPREPEPIERITITK